MKEIEFALPPPNLPILRPDQLLYDWSGRVHEWNGNMNVTHTSMQLFGSRYTALQHDFPARLEELSLRTRNTLPAVQELALCHTLMGYFLPLISIDAAHKLLCGVIAGAVPSIKYQLGLPASRLGASHPLKWCTECFQEDIDLCAFGYWHVCHQYPSTLICVRHQRPLRIANDSMTPVHRRRWIFPGTGAGKNWIDIDVPQNSISVLLKLARFSSRFAQLSPGALEAEKLAKVYQASLGRNMFVTPGGSLRLQTLVKFVRDYFSGLEDLPGMNILRAVRPEWPGLIGTLARKSPRNGHPLKHLLMITMLFDSWDAFMAQYNETSLADSPLPPSASPPATPPNDVRIDEFAELIRQRKISIRKAATEIGISVTTGVRWANLKGISFTQRKKSLTPTFLAKVRKLLQQGLPKTAVVALAGISSVSLNRLISTEPDLAREWRCALEVAARAKNRKQFLALVDANPGVPTNTLRKIPGNGYQWLYRHDRDWLINHLPGLWNLERES